MRPYQPYRPPSSDLDELSVFNLKAGNTVATRAALERVRAGTGRGRILYVGDSTTAGPRALDATFQNSRFLSHPAVTADLLQAAGIETSFDSAVGFSGIDVSDYSGEYNPNLTFGAGWTSSGATLGGGGFANSTTDTELAFTVREAVDRFEVRYFRTGSSTSAFVWKVDDGAWSAPISQVGATIGLLVLNSANAPALATPGIHTVYIKRSVTGVTLMSIFAYDTNRPALDVINAGCRGATSTEMATATNIWSPLPCITNFDPDVTFLNAGINDWRNNTAATATYRNNMQALITTAKAEGDCWLTAPFPSATSGSAGDFASVANQQTYRSILYSLAILNDIPLVDRTVMFESWAEANADGMAYDNLHPTIDGYAHIGGVDAGLILNLPG